MQDYSGLTLIVPDKSDPERDAIAAAWSVQDGEVLRLGRFWEPPDLDPTSVRVYGNDTFCLVLAEKLGLRLVSPPDDLIRQVPRALLRREVAITTIGEVIRGSFPMFVKLVTPKQFAARVYQGPGELEQETRGLHPETPVIESAVVGFEAECRAFILEGRVVASSVYEGASVVPNDFLSEMVGQPPNKPLHLPAAGFSRLLAVAPTHYGSLPARPQLSRDPLGGATVRKAESSQATGESGMEQVLPRWVRLPLQLLSLLLAGILVLFLWAGLREGVPEGPSLYHASVVRPDGSTHELGLTSSPRQCESAVLSYARAHGLQESDFRIVCRPAGQ